MNEAQFSKYLALATTPIEQLTQDDIIQQGELGQLLSEPMAAEIIKLRTIKREMKAQLDIATDLGEKRFREAANLRTELERAQTPLKLAYNLLKDEAISMGDVVTGGHTMDLELLVEAMRAIEGALRIPAYWQEL